MDLRSDRTRLQVMAAANNASWCDVMCRTHGIDTQLEGDAWTSSTRSPPFYPDAITLVPEASALDVLARIDSAPGCSIKDSFALLDLSADGFRVLFEAQWIVRNTTATRPATATRPWELIRETSGLAEWEEAWRGERGHARLFRPELLEWESVAVVATRAHGRIVSGAVLNRTAAVVGISNFFSAPTASSASWADSAGHCAEPRLRDGRILTSLDPRERRAVSRTRTAFAERLTIVTGGASGIGRELGAELRAFGAHVVLADLDGAGAERAAEELTASAAQAGGSVVRVEVDVCDRAGVQALFHNWRTSTTDHEGF